MDRLLVRSAIMAVEVRLTWIFVGILLQNLLLYLVMRRRNFLIGRGRMMERRLRLMQEISTLRPRNVRMEKVVRRMRRSLELALPYSKRKRLQRRRKPMIQLELVK